ncbi:MAG: hypothetical protein N3B10_01615 [Armatimonadetes bacterium]|nr:hypothetical protein [Armatimonadota bacterium]MCX7967165.1 hypothetical protein [Armatimonadota bacterium]MDW8141935.1 hypothetical protein [Armatimonadota bacterium]
MKSDRKLYFTVVGKRFHDRALGFSQRSLSEILIAVPGRQWGTLAAR